MVPQTVDRKLTAVLSKQIICFTLRLLRNIYMYKASQITGKGTR